MLENDKISQYFQSNLKYNKTCPRKMPGKENEYKRESIGKRKIPNKSMMDVSDSDGDWLVPSPAFSKKKFSSRKENILQNQLKEKGSKREPNCIIIDLEDNNNYNNIVQNNDSDKNSSKQITTGASSTPQNTTECDSKNISYKESITNNDKDSGNNKPSFKSKKNISQKVEDKSIVTHVEQEVLPLTDDENFDISRAKKLSEKERHLDQIHNALLKTSKEGLHKASRKNENLKKVKGMNKRQKEQKLCVICSTCRCAKGSILHELEQSTINESKSPLQNFARSDNEVERALLSRLSRLEKSAAWYDHLCFKVNRELKKHRSKALKRLLDENSVKEKPTFLEDVAIGDDFVMKHGIAPSIPSSLAQRARKKVFSFRKKRQPTLTQMLGKDQNLSDESTDECELEHDTKEDSKCVLQSNSSEQKHENEEIIDLMDESHEIVETCDDEISSEKYLVEEDTFENQMAEFYDASYRKDNRIEELGFHTKTGNIMWDLSKSSEIPNISHIRVAELSSNAERVESSTITEKNSCQVNNECSSFYKTDQITNMMQSFDFTQSNDQADGMSHLLELFNGVDNSTEPFSFVDANDDASIVWNSRDKNGIPNFSQLSQQGQANAQEIERNVDNDPEKRILIENICPNWKENVSFALLQKNPIELNYALDNLNEERGRMVRVMEKITNAYEQRNLVLDLYQSALEKSLKRSSTIDDNPCSVKTGKNETSSKTSERSSTINLAGCLQNQILQDRNKLVDSSIKTDLFTIDESDSEDSLLSCSQNPSSKKERLDQSDSHSERLPPIQHKNARDEIVQSDDSEQLNVDLTSLETTKLKLLMEKYGLKAQSRSRMINILSEVFDTIRKDSFGIEETSPIQSQNSVQSRDGTSEPLKVTKKRKQKLQDIEELRRLCREAIDKDTRLKLRILSHESIEFSEIEQTILNAGIQISKKSLSDWLDKSKIRYADPWRQRK